MYVGDFGFLRNFLFVLLIIPSVVSGSSTEQFDIGVKAAKVGQYRVALEAFIHAESAGLDTPELTYNLGVVYYKLGQFTAAGEYFQKLSSDDQYAAIAFYNLGLVSLKLNDRSSANQWFKNAYASASDPKIITLAARAIDRLKGVEVPPEPAQKEWKGFVSTNIGYDSNVASVDEVFNQTQGPGDFNAEFLATTSRMLWGDKSGGLGISGNIYFIEHDKEHDYDYSQWHGGFEYFVESQGWKFRAMASMAQTRVGNIDYLESKVGELRGKYPYGKNRWFELRYKYYDIDDLGPNNEYDYLHGVKQQVRARINYRAGAFNWRLSYSFEHNDRQDSNISYTKTDLQNQTIAVEKFRSYSPIRHTTQISAKYNLNHTDIFLETQYRYSNYQNADTTIENDTVTYQNIREDNRYRVTFGVEHNINRQWQIFAYYRFTKNDSDGLQLDYERSQAITGVSWFY